MENLERGNMTVNIQDLIGKRERVCVSERIKRDYRNNYKDERRSQRNIRATKQRDFNKIYLYLSLSVSKINFLLHLTPK